MNKIISSFTIATLLVSSFGGFPLIATAANNNDQGPDCTVQTIEIVSDTTNVTNTTRNTDTYAVATYTGNPLWSANIPGAIWIWDSAEVVDGTVDHTVVFTKKFKLDGGKISSAVFDIAADNGYKLEINGTTIDNKLAIEKNYQSADQAHYDVLSLFPHLVHPGNNTIKITVKNFGLAESVPHSNPAGLLYKMTIGLVPPGMHSKTLVSNTETQVNNHDAVPVSPTHELWTASIPDATWIWSENPILDPINETTQTFTRTFTIGGTPTDATLDIATDNSYSVTVNEHPVESGDSTFVAAHQVTIPAADLKPGKNTITFTVKNLALENGTAATNPAGLLYKVSYQTDACADETIPEDTHAEKGTIQLKNVVTPHDDSSWNAGIDASYTFWATWIHDSYDSGPIEVDAGNHSVVIQTAPGVDGLQYASTLSCMDGATEVATGGPDSLVYGDNLVSSNISVAPNQHIVCTFTNTKTPTGTIRMKNVVTPHDDSSWNIGIDASYTFWATWIHDGYDSGPISVSAGDHSVVGQTAPGVNGLEYISNMDCVDGSTHIASSTYGSLIYGQNLVSSGFTVAPNQNVVCTFTSVLHRAPNTPVLLSPANGSIKKAAGLVLDWSDVTATSSPVTYIYESSLSPATTTDNAFVSPIYNTSLSVSEIDASGSADNTYYWHVRACDAINSCSPWSDAWKITVDSTAPVSAFTSPNPDTEFLDDAGIVISGTTTDLHDVASTTLAFAPFTGGVCGAFTPIVTINSTTLTTSFGWTHTWIPEDAGTYCLTAHGEDIAGNREASPIVSNITYKKTTTPVTPPAGGGGNGGGGGGTTDNNGSTGGGNGGNGGGGSGGNGPVVGSYGVGGDNSGGGNGGNTSPISDSGITFLSANDNTGGGINTDSKKIATIYGSAGAGISNEPGTLTSTSSQTDGSAVSGDNSNQTASVFAGASWLTWQNGLWILLILLLIALIVWFVSRRKENQ